MFIRKAKLKKLLQEEFERGVATAQKKEYELTNMVIEYIANYTVQLVEGRKKAERKKIAEEVLKLLKKV